MQIKQTRTLSQEDTLVPKEPSFVDVNNAAPRLGRQTRQTRQTRHVRCLRLCIVVIVVVSGLRQRRSSCRPLTARQPGPKQQTSFWMRSSYLVLSSLVSRLVSSHPPPSWPIVSESPLLGFRYLSTSGVLVDSQSGRRPVCILYETALAAEYSLWC